MSELFDTELSMKLWGEDLKRQGREEGRILETVDIYRNEMDLDDATIIDKIIGKFGLTRTRAESYVLKTA